MNEANSYRPPKLIASADGIFDADATRRDRKIANVYGDATLAHFIATAVNRDHLFERLVKRLKSTAKWCPNCSGRGSHTGWDKKRLTTKRVDCRRCAPTRALLAEVTS